MGEDRVTNLNRLLQLRREDVGDRDAAVSGIEIIPHLGRIEDKPVDFYKDFDIIILDLDSIEARSYTNSVACGFLEYNAEGKARKETIKPMIDGGTQDEGFKRHARVIVPGVNPCFECTVKFPLYTLEPPRTAAHCIEYARFKWNEAHSGKSFDPNIHCHVRWVYFEAVKRAELFGLHGVTFSLTDDVVRNEMPVFAPIAPKDADISAACALETLKMISGCSETLYNGVEGLRTEVTEFMKEKDCLVCGPGILLELDSSVTLKMFIDRLEEHPKLLLTKVSITYRGKKLYMQAPPVLEETTRPNLDSALFELMDKIPEDTIHATGLVGKGETKQSSLRKLRVAFKGLEGVTDVDSAHGA